MALFAMLLQVVFTAEHYSALAATVSGIPGKAGGFLQICTPQGLARVAAPGSEGTDDPAPATGGGPACAICGSVATAGAVDLPIMATVPVPADDWPVAMLAIEQQTVAPRFTYLIPAPRGPPTL